MELLEEEHKKATRKAMQLLEHMDRTEKGLRDRLGLAGSCLGMALAVALNGLLWKPEVIAANGGAREFLSTSGIGYSVLVAGYGKDYSQLMLHPWLMYVQRFLLMFYSMNLGVGLFNLLPIPPLDGYHIFNDILFKGRFRLNQQVFQIAQVVLLLACFSGLLNNVINVVFDAVEGGVLNLFLLIAGQA